MLQKRFRALVVVAASGSVLACKGTAELQPSAQAAWRDQLERLASKSTGLYSYRFVDAPPTGAFFRVGVHLEPPTQACSRYAGTADGSADFWFLAIDIQDLNPGAHNISLKKRTDGPVSAANVTLLHRKNDAYVESYDALGGVLQVDSAPSIDQSKDGTVLAGSVDAEFPLHALQEVRCFGGMVAGSDAAAAQNYMCKDDDGLITNCAVPPLTVGCCHDLGSERIKVHVSLEATPCIDMCAFAAGLPDYCLDLVQ